jgi:hypothetical protein
MRPPRIVITEILGQDAAQMAVLADLDIRSKIVAIGPRLGRFASPIAFRHNLLHHSQERIGPCG